MAKAEKIAIVVTGLGLRGVNVDRNPFELADNDLTRAANFISESVSGRSSIRKRAGLLAFATTTEGTVLGGIDLPLADELNGQRFLYIGRGPT